MWVTRRGLLTGLVAGSITALAGCGFRLRGMGGAQATYQTAFLRFDNAVPFELKQALAQAFRASQVMLVESAEDAQLLVELGLFQRDLSRTSISVSGQTTAELIHLSQQVTAYRMADEAQVMNGAVVVMRDRQIDPSQLLAAERELQSITQEMMQSLAMNIVNQINRSYLALQP